ncbi:type VI secretion system tip protein VgrG [Aliiglaciecola sp. CAU 1673]|uniref:type VI secretion system tip protein VgrG n=1 Tax=Aliiglaciecola sp. CAU 1673 TaxID=3032595 RepID=UPI0023DC15A6|nr:type VI secretion system tip protein VgrG [Aliiglaciecola sp. CAU 1673]MDF2177190.1 type VI secretion system tip protein VgrG [Aliiglaciecola sp. CAU 1673]
MADSILTHSDGPLRITISCNGKDIDDSIGLISVEVIKAVNRIPSATLTFADGDMPSQDFPLSNQDLFKPGAEVVIKAGYDQQEEQIFAGVITRHGLSFSEHQQARLVLECKDKIFAATLGRQNANYQDSKDSDILSLIGGKYADSTDVDATTAQLEKVVQYYCCDWDFMLTRAEVNGLLVFVDDGKLSIKAPDTGATPTYKLTYGEDLISFNANLEAGHQYQNVSGYSWDPASQQVLSQSADPDALTSQGNLDAKTLAQIGKLSEFRLQHPGPLSQEQCKSWAGGQQLKSALARIRGELRCQGQSKVKPGCLLELAGLGERFNGKVFVSRVEHRLEQGNWLCQVSFGMSPQWSAQNRDIEAPPAAGLLPGISGLNIGIVKQLDQDPQAGFRIMVEVPLMQTENPGIWARLLSHYASNQFGYFCVPEIGDEVLLGYLNDDPTSPVVLGSLYSKSHPAPYEMEADNNIKAMVTRAGLKMEFDEQNKRISLLTPANNQLILDEDGKRILIQDQNDNQIELNESGISLQSPKDIQLKAQGNISLKAQGNVDIEATGDCTSKGMNINHTAQTGFTAKGNASAELSASGQTTVKGAMVMIN